MTSFNEPVRDHMVYPVHTVQENDRLATADQRMSELGVSALPVLDRTSRLAGVLSRSDLLRAGRVRVTEDTREHVLNLPAARVREHMNPTVEVLTSTAPLSLAAQRMLERHYHRLFVVYDGSLLGVVSTREMMRGVHRTRMRIPIEEVMTPDVVSVQVDDPIVLAIDRMAASHHAGLVVLGDNWPVGIFSQVEALAARDASPQRPVEEWMSHSFVCVPAGMPVHYAAAQALATRAGRVIAVDRVSIQGIVTGMDFTRLVAEAVD